ncbi:MAG: threonylcarbamoyl-AMP synthase, partial [Opitutaceae bacterium]|nr:threonylcarbamoyl-AMP synthase [Opitutaceae bacterium]
MTRLRTRIFRGTPRNLALLAGKLREGELVAVPTETVYGLAADAWNADACAAIFQAKGRPTSDPLIVHIHHLDQLAELARTNPAARKLAKQFWPGPLTMVLPKTHRVPAIVTAGKASVAVRMPAHPLFRRLLKQCGRPLAAPSANPFGYVSPTTAQHVRDHLGGKIRYILDGGAASVGLESTIVDLRNPARPAILRPGAISAAQISRVLGRKVRDYQPRAATSAKAQIAPGQLAQHYSPKAKVTLHVTIPTAVAESRSAVVAVMYFKQPAGPHRPHVFWLSATGNQAAAARALFAQLRSLY